MVYFVKFDNSIISTTSTSFYMAIDCQNHQVFSRNDEKEFMENISNKDEWSEYSNELDYNGLRLLTFCDRYVEYTSIDVFGNTLYLNPLLATGEYHLPKTSVSSGHLEKKIPPKLNYNNIKLKTSKTYDFSENGTYLYTIVGESVLPIDLFEVVANNSITNKNENLKIAVKRKMNSVEFSYSIYE